MCRHIFISAGILKESFMKIEEIDKNFKSENSVNEVNSVYLSVKNAHFELYGFARKEKFLRIPQEVANRVNPGVARLGPHTAGGRVRFKTDSPYIAIRVEYPYITNFPHMPLTGTSGFDVYTFSDGEYAYVKTFNPTHETGNSFEDIHKFGTSEMRDITINFPLYNAVDEVYIGLDKDSSLECGGKYIGSKPIVYYGSSITQGGCASRPGNAYQAILSRRYNADFVNLGFSGNATGETEIANYIASLEMSVFVYDYDHNAPTVEHLKNTHESMFKTIRASHPDIPIIMMTRPFDNDTENVKARKAVVFGTYKNAVESGDKNVYFIDGEKMKDIMGGFSGTVDGCHPNDLGFICMAKALEGILDPLADKYLKD